MSPIDPTVPACLSDAAQHLSVFAAQTATPPAGAEDRVWQAVQARVAAGDLGPDLPPQSAAGPAGLRAMASAWRTWLGASIGVTALIGAAVLWFPPGAGPGSNAGGEGSAAPAAEAGEEARGPIGGEGTHGAELARRDASLLDPLAAPQADGLDPGSADGTPGAGIEAERGAAQGAPPDPAHRKIQRPRAGDGDPLALEVEGLGQARQALQAGEPRRALKVLDRLDRSVGRGTMGDERDLTRVTALCKLEQVDAARKVAAALRARVPSSAMLRKLDGSCAGQ